MSLKILHGGLIRATFDVASGSGAFDKGNVLELDSAGEAKLSASSAYAARGLAVEKQRSSTATSADSLAGVPSGEKVSMLMDEAVVETDQITSGVSFKVNQAVYTDTSGDLTDTTNKAYDQVLGIALADADWTGTLKMLLSVQY